MFKKISSLIEYIGWLYKTQNELQKYNQGSIFRISKIRKNKNNEVVLHIKVINKLDVFLRKPSEIVANDYLLEGFSKKDIRMITYLATQELHKPTHKITSHHHDDELDKIAFTLTKKDGKTYNMTADQVSQDKELINKLSQQDAHRIGYQLAIEQMILENNLMKKL
ncbi:MAG: hypothetical protein EPO11_06245 [Gammaproteobacteria bacterium]|nr:MAG: hypothetical protein EPO11_06245 [Gammaproteobacteria bacterium]